MKAADITNETQVTEQNYNDILKFAKDGNATAQYVLGLYYYDKGEFKEAVSWYTKAAEQNHAVAQNKLGNCYLNGEGIPEDKEQAIFWYKKSAKQEYPNAQCNLARCFQNGFGIEKNEIKAYEWYSKSAENGFPAAEYFLGWCYAKGIGVGKDESKAFEFFKKSSEDGYVEDQNDLGVRYKEGIGIERDEEKAFKCFLTASENGDLTAKVNLAHCYKEGKGTEKDEAKAFKLYLDSVNNGLDAASCFLGLCYEEGAGTEKDEYKAFECYLNGAKQGDPNAQYKLGNCYANGIGTEIDEIKAFDWYLKAAEQGSDLAQFNLGVCYANGKGTEKNDVKAFEWNLKTAQQGLDVAQYNLGVFYENGIGTTKDEDKAFNWYIKAAEQGYANAQYNLGACYQNGTGTVKDETEAFEWYQKAANQGLAIAQNNLGCCYQNGIGTKKDEVKAFELYLKSADQGYVNAQFNLGNCYQYEIGTKKDEIKAFEWYLKAASQGLYYAQYSLGWCYRNGIGIEKNGKKAFEWYLKASEQGFDIAQLNLGWCYQFGIGTEKDEEKAFKLYLKATEQGLDIAQLILACCYQNGFGTKKDEAKALEWYQKVPDNEYAFAQFGLGLLYLISFKDYKKAETCLLKASKDEGFKNSYNWLAVICFAQKRDVEGFAWAKKSAELDDALGCFILSSAYYHGKGTEQSAAKGDSFYKKAIEKGLAIEPEEALALDPITNLKIIDFNKLSNDDYASTLLKSNLFPKTDFILAKMQKKQSGFDGFLTADSIKGTTTRALQNILGVRPLLMEEMLRNKAEKRGKCSPLDSMLIGGMLLPEYYSKKLETFDYTKEDDPSKFMDQQVRHARSTAEDYWDNNKYKEIKKIFDFLVSAGKEISVLENEDYTKDLIAKLFSGKGEKAIDNLYQDVKEEYIRRTSKKVSISSSDEEGEYTIDIKDESVLSPEEAFIQKEEHAENLLKLKQFVKGFDDTLRKGTSKETASIFMVRLLVPSPAKDKGDYEQKMGLTSIVSWLNKISADFSIDEIKNILAETRFFSADIDWFYAEQFEGKTAMNNEEISKKLGIEPAAFTRTYNKTLIPKLIDYWNLHKAELED